MKKSLLALAALATVAAAVPLTPVLADPPRWNDRDRDGRNDRWDRHDNRRDRGNYYDSRGRYREPRRITRDSRVWRGGDGRYYCKRDNGTTGLIIGAGAGALAGHEIAGNGDRTLGTILGGVLGGALGREIDKGDIKCR